jgi:hypothetical protein
VQRFKPSDAVFILPKYAHLYPGNSAVVNIAHADPFRQMFNSYVLEFSDGSTDKLFEFQIIDAAPDFQTLIASVAFDSCYQTAAVQTRGSHSGRQVILQTEEFDVDMRLHATKSRASIMGQVLERDAKTLLKDVVEVRLMREGMPITSTMSDGVGVFGFDDVPRGSLNILVVLPSRRKRLLGNVPV